MTQKEIIAQQDKMITVNLLAIKKLEESFRALTREWKIYEESYRKYVSRKTRVKRFFVWLYYKVTFKTKPKLTRVKLIKRTADKMASIFHE